MPRAALIVVAVVVTGLVVAQVVLPEVAEHRLAGELRSSGDIRRISVKAVPAVKLLGEHADRVEVRLGAMTAGPSRLGELIDRTRGAEQVDARAATLQVGRFALSDLRLVKNGGALTGQAVLSDTALRDALPATVGFRPVESADGQLVLEATAAILGVSARIRARLSAQDGALVVAPDGIPLGGLATVTVFRDPRVVVTGVGARRTPDGYALTATGTPARR
ncbi:MAG TPA: hypothetical protein VF533_22520 [Solirubrobacteraceae bacterium]